MQDSLPKRVNGVGGPESISSSPSDSGVAPSSDLLPGFDVLPGFGPPATSGDADCCRCTGGTSIPQSHSQVTFRVSIALFAHVCTRNESGA